jgi:hypothetical protein
MNMGYRKLTASSVYRWASEINPDDDGAIIYHARTKEPFFRCHASVIPLIKAAGKIKPFAEYLKILKPGAI